MTVESTRLQRPRTGPHVRGRTAAALAGARPVPAGDRPGCGHCRGAEAGRDPPARPCPRARQSRGHRRRRDAVPHAHRRLLVPRRGALRRAAGSQGGLMAPITFEHVTKRFDEVTAVDDLNIEVGDGEFLVFVGPSGCGKTTALRMLAGLEDITGGRILIGDRVGNNAAPGARDVAMVFQSYALYPPMKVYDNLAFGL